MPADRLLHYADPTGNTAAANVDRAQRNMREAAAAHVWESLNDQRVNNRTAAYLVRAFGALAAA